MSLTHRDGPSEVLVAARVGWASVKACWLPMVVLWFLSVATVVSYYGCPGFAAMLEPLRRWQVESGCLASFLSRFFFCGVLPGVFLVTVKSIRPKYACWSALAQGLWGGFGGIVYDFIYRGQSWLFGDGTDGQTLLVKMLVDQFVITVVYAAPVNACIYFWFSRDFSFRRFKAEFPRPFLTRALLPNLVTNWCVWIPVVTVIYAFPQQLQLQVSGFACAFWTLTCLQISSRSHAK